MKKFFALVAFLCTVMISSMAMAANWVWICSDENFTIYVDNNSIRRDYNYSDYVFRAFVKCVFSDSGRNRLIETRRAYGLPIPKGIYNLSYDVSLEYFKMSDGIKYNNLLNSTFYTYDGNTIPEMGFSFSSLQKWEIINPDSIGELKFDKIYARVPN